MGKNIVVTKNPDVETPLSITGESFNGHILRVDWYNAGEGLSGDYNPDDPNDVNLLRFDAYAKESPSEPDWTEVEDASYCTQIPADSSDELLEASLKYLFSEYMDVIDGYFNGSSVKKLGERLSWIEPKDFILAEK